jgi:hypothetical protein
MNTFKHQGKHLVALILLLLPVFWFSLRPGTLDGEWLGLATKTWFWIAILIPVVHQFGVMLAWRLELHHQWMSKILGDAAFSIFKAFFFPGLIARPISVLILALSDRESSIVPGWILDTIALLMTPVLLYLFYSIVRYFGISRAAGADHFLEDDRTKPLVRKGLFRYLPNAMYVTGFFAIWIPALVLASNAAMVAAAFQHLLIWAHYFFTEEPDMQVIYGGRRSAGK